MRTVTMIGTLPPVKGISPYTQALCEELAKKVHIEFIGFKQIYPEFLYPGGTKIPGAKAPRIKNLQNRSFLTWYNPFTWIWAGLSCKGDIVHAQWWSWPLAPMYLVILALAKLRGKKIILTVHNAEPHERSFFRKLLNGSVIHLANKLVVHSEKTASTVHSNYKLPVYIQPLPVSVLPHSLATVSSIRIRWNLPSDLPIIVFFGNIRPYKGVEVLLNACKKIPGVYILIAGRSWYNPAELERMVKSKELRGRVQLHLRYLSDVEVSEIMRLADVVVCPYVYFDASSAAASVALSYGKALVVTNVGGLPDVVIDKRVIAEPNHVISLRQSLLYALKNKKILESDALRVRKKFSAVAASNVLLEAYFD